MDRGERDRSATLLAKFAETLFYLVAAGPFLAPQGLSVQQWILVASLMLGLSVASIRLSRKKGGHSV